MTLDQIIREAATSGRLAGLTVWRTVDGRYQASVSADGVSWRCDTNADPIAALVRVLGGQQTPPDTDIFG